MKIIAGPCQLESSEHAIEIASALKELCDKYDFEFYFKSSYDKANRTSIHGKRGPGIFQGIQWLSEVRDEVGCKVLTDVHEVWQIKEVLPTVDVLQIPAFLCRQTDLLVRSVELASLTDKIVNIKEDFMQRRRGIKVYSEIKKSLENLYNLEIINLYEMIISKIIQKLFRVYLSKYFLPLIYKLTRKNINF